MLNFLSEVVTSDVYKGLLVLFVSAFMPITACSFLWVRRIKKEAEFARVVRLLGIARDEVDFARDRVAEQYADRDYVLPVGFCWFLSVLGLVSLLFGPQLVDDHPGRMNFLLTGLFRGSPEEMQNMREQSMVLLSIGFLGAFFWSVRNIIRRLSAGDLAPAVYFDTSIRVVLAPILSLMAGHLSISLGANVDGNLGMVVVAFLIGFFPDEAIEYLKEHAPLKIFSGTQSAHDLPLSMIEGLSVYDRARLDELGICNAQNLATANFVKLMVRTPYNPILIIDWIGQARLYVYFKDEIQILRAHRIRTIFDLIESTTTPDQAKILAERSDMNKDSLARVGRNERGDPVVKQLLGYRDVLLGVSDEPDR